MHTSLLSCWLYYHTHFESNCFGTFLLILLWIIVNNFTITHCTFTKFSSLSVCHYELCCDDIWGFTWEPQSSLKRKHQWILASGFYTPEPLPMHMGINRRQVYPLFRFLLRSRVGEQCWSPQNLSSIWLESCSWLVLRCEQRCPCLQRLGTSTKRADFLKEQSMEGSRLLKMSVLSVSSWLLLLPVFWGQTRSFFFSVWVSNTLKLRLWMTHAFTVSVWAWTRCDLASLLWKEGQPSTATRPSTSLARAENRRLALWENWWLQ